MGENPFEPTRGSRNHCSQEFTGFKRRCFPVFPKVDTPYGQALTGLRVQAPLGARVQRVQKVQRVVVAAGAAGLLKSVLRDLLSVSYGMISILRIGSLCSPPPIRLRRTSPLFRGQNKIPRNTLFINGSTVSTGYSATTKWGWQRNWIHRGAPQPANPVTCFSPGKVVAPATKGGMHFRRPQGGCMVFRRAKARL